VYDITIIGAGPAGLFATFYAGMRQMKTKIIDALEEPGGQVAVLYPEKYIFDVPGFKKVLAKDLLKDLIDQAFQFSPTVVMGERVTGLSKTDGVFELSTERGNKHYSKTVLVATGVGAFSPNRLEAPGVAAFEGRGVYYYVKDKSAFTDKNLLIVGGGDSAVDWALNLKDVARRITLIHRRDIFRAHEQSVDELMRSGVDVKLFHEVKEVIGGAEGIKQVVIFDNRSKAETTLDIDAILVNIGFRADLGPIKNWGLNIIGRQIKSTGNLETDVPGLYVAGDVAGPEGSVSLNLITTVHAQAALAVNVAKAFIDPSSKVFPGHSSERKA